MKRGAEHQAALITTAEFFRFFIKTLIGIGLARLLSPTDLGGYRQLFLIYSTFSAILIMGIPHSILYFLPRQKSSQEKIAYISRLMNLSFGLSLLFALILYFLRLPIATWFHNPALSSLLIIYSIYPIFMFSSSLYNYLMLGLSNAASAAKFTLFSVFSDAVLILGVALITKDLHFITVAVVVSASLQWIYTKLSLRRYHSFQAPSWDFLKTQFSYALPLGISSMVGMLSVQLDKFVISSYFDPAAFAVFSIGAMELPFVSIFTNSINSVLLPEMSAQNNASDMAMRYRAAVRKNALVIFPLAALFFLFAKPIFGLLYGSKYLAAVPYFKVYLLVLPLRIASFGIIFMALGKTKQVMLNSILTLALNLVLNIILVKRLGMMGAALATVIVTWLSMGVYLIWMKAFLKLKLSAFFALWPVFKTAVAVMGAAVLAHLSLRFCSNQYLGYACALTAFLAVYLVLGYSFQAILPYDLLLAKSFIFSFFKKGTDIHEES